LIIMHYQEGHQCPAGGFAVSTTTSRDSGKGQIATRFVQKGQIRAFKYKGRPFDEKGNK